MVLRKTQYRISDDEQQSLGIARSFLFGKLHNSRWVLERAMRDHPMRLDATKVADVRIETHRLQRGRNIVR